MPRDYKRVKESTKKCGTCSKFKTFDNFWNRSQNKDGKRSSCKECEAESLKVWADKNKHREPIHVDFKWCRECLTTLSRDKFTFSKISRDHLKDICSKCSTNKHANWMRKEKSKPISRKYYLKGKFGITQETFDDMRRIQNNKCDICTEDFIDRSDGRGIQIDHSHTTGFTRGLLCQKCNTMLAGVEKAEFLEKALEYLDRYLTLELALYVTPDLQ